MSIVEKILDHHLTVHPYLAGTWKQDTIDAMKEIAWKSWEEASSFDLGLFNLADKHTKVRWENEKSRFEIWWNEQIPD